MPLGANIGVPATALSNSSAPAETPARAGFTTRPAAASVALLLRAGALTPKDLLLPLLACGNRAECASSWAPVASEWGHNREGRWLRDAHAVPNWPALRQA